MFINWEQTIINILNYILSAVSVKINIVNTHAHGLVDFSLNLFHLLCVSVFFAYLFFRCEMIFDFSLFFMDESYLHEHYWEACAKKNANAHHNIHKAQN